jgi:hypothetical protein
VTATHEQSEMRHALLQRLVVRRRFTATVMGYVVTVSGLSGAWTFTGTGSCWITAPLSGIGAALALHAWAIFPRRSIADVDIDAEVEHQRSRLLDRPPTGG